MVDLSRVPGPGLPAGRDSAPESDSACPSGIPRPRHKALSMVLQRFLSLVLHRFLISSPDLRIDARFSPFTRSCVHRFLISGPDLGIDVGFCLFMNSCVHRFLISSPDLRIDVGFCLFMHSCVHRFLISGPDLRIDAAENCLPAAAVAATLFRVRLYFTLLQRGMVSPATVVCGIDMKRPILIFVAAKKKSPMHRHRICKMNGPPAE